MVRQHACAALVGIMVLWLVSLPVCAGEADVKKPEPQVSAEAAIERALDSKITFEFDQTPLPDAVEFFKQHNKINISIHAQELTNAGISHDVPLTLHIKDVTFRSGLKRLLGSVDLAFVVQDEVLQITTAAAAAAVQVVRTYDVSDLVKHDASEPVFTGDSLIDAVQNAVFPNTWDLNGGPGALSYFDGLLVVAQTDEVQQEVVGLLRAIREARTADHSKGDVQIWAQPTADESKAIQAALDKRVSLSFDNTPLIDAVEFLRDQHKLPIVIDTKSLEEVGIAVDAPISVALENVRLENALKHALQPANLMYVIRDEMLLVTSQEKASANVVSAVYGVRDLLESSAQTTGGDSTDAGEALVDLITSAVAPSMWDLVGGPGKCYALPSFGELVVSQTAEVHTKVQALLKQLHQGVASRKATAKGDAPRTETFKLVIYTISPAGEATEGEKKDDVRQPSAEELEKLLPELVAKESWQKPQALIRASGDRLFIRQTSAVHRKVAQFLGVSNYVSSDSVFGGGGGFFSVPDLQLKPLR